MASVAVLGPEPESPESRWQQGTAGPLYIHLFRWDWLGRQEKTCFLKAQLAVQTQRHRKDSIGLKMARESQHSRRLHTSVDVLKHLCILAHTWMRTLCRIHTDHGHTQFISLKGKSAKLQRKIFKYFSSLILFFLFFIFIFCHLCHLAL